MAYYLHDVIHYFIVVIGLVLNLSTIVLILHKTAKELKEYSLLLLNTSVIELGSILAKLLVHCRLFLHSYTSIIISEGPCYSISDNLCSVAIGFMHVNMMQSNAIISLSFWYRTRVLREKAVLGRVRLQLIIILLFLPHIFHIFGAWAGSSPREELAPIVENVYGSNSTVNFGLFGYTDFTKFSTLLIIAYLCIIPLFHNNYIVYARRKLIAMFAEKMQHMSAKTRKIHESFTMVLTITALTLVVVQVLMTIGAVPQAFFNIHSPLIESIVYNGAVLPALVNPALTLYFVGSYRTFLVSYFNRLSRRMSISPLITNSVQFIA